LIGLEKIISATIDKKEKKISFQDKTVKNILNGLEASKQVPFEKVLFALGIRYVGQTVAKKLVHHYHDIEKLKNVSFEDLILVDEVGDKIAESVTQFFLDEKNLKIIERMKNSGVQFKQEFIDTRISDILEGKTIIASGKLANFSRDEIKQTIADHGGKAVSSVTKKVDFVLAGENIGPNKLAKAKELGIPVISEEEFLEMIKKDLTS
jgi:DNA ligase (NAD+)